MTDSHPLDPAIQQLNRRLKAAQLGLQVERRGEKLSLRGTLPPRPQSPRLRPHQQRIPLGLPATKTGLKQVEREAKIVAARLIEQNFDWRSYLSPGSGAVSEAIEVQVAAFAAEFLKQPGASSHRRSARQSTWDKTYAPYLRRLVAVQQQRPTLNRAEAIYATLQDISPVSRSRQVACTALGAFAEFCGTELPVDLKTFWGSYSGSRSQRRELPSEEAILAGFEQIPNPAWRFVYGIMATYGLRNHEVFFCDYQGLRERSAEARITVLETTKTGLHDVWPFHPEWVERFGLQDINLPPVSTDLQRTTLQRIGQQVSTQFRRYDLPFSPYDLRHAWAVRTIHFGLSDTVAARMMGHSVAIHTRTYHRWITLRDQQQAVQAALARRQP